MKVSQILRISSGVSVNGFGTSGSGPNITCTRSAPGSSETLLMGRCRTKAAGDAGRPAEVDVADVMAHVAEHAVVEGDVDRLVEAPAARLPVDARRVAIRAAAEGLGRRGRGQRRVVARELPRAAAGGVEIGQDAAAEIDSATEAISVPGSRPARHSPPASSHSAWVSYAPETPA